jgi:hypothetical protein
VIVASGIRRYRAALEALGRTPSSLASVFPVTSRTVRGWNQIGPPPEVLAWLEACAQAVRAIPVPLLTERRGRPRSPTKKRVVDRAKQIKATAARREALRRRKTPLPVPWD